MANIQCALHAPKNNIIINNNNKTTLIIINNNNTVIIIIIINNNNNNKRTISSTISISTTKDAHAHCGVEVNMEATVLTVLLIYIQVDVQWKPGANSQYDNEDEEKESHILNCGILLSNEV